METKIELLKPLYINGTTFQAGQLKLVNELHARELVKKGYAILVVDLPRQGEAKKENEEVEPDAVIENSNMEEEEKTESVEPKKENPPKNKK